MCAHTTQYLGHVRVPRLLDEGQGQLGKIDHSDCWTPNSFDHQGQGHFKGHLNFQGQGHFEVF